MVCVQWQSGAEGRVVGRGQESWAGMDWQSSRQVCTAHCWRGGSQEGSPRWMSFQAQELAQGGSPETSGDRKVEGKQPYPFSQPKPTPCTAKQRDFLSPGPEAFSEQTVTPSLWGQNQDCLEAEKVSKGFADTLSNPSGYRWGNWDPERRRGLCS